MRAVAAHPCPVVEVYGEIDIATVGELRAMIDSTKGAGADQLILDLSGIRFIDSSGLNVLIGTARQLGSGSFAVIVGRPSIRRIFALSGIDNVIPIFASVADAVDALRNAAAKDANIRSTGAIPDPTETCEAGTEKVELVLMAQTDLETAPSD